MMRRPSQGRGEKHEQPRSKELRVILVGSYPGSVSPETMTGPKRVAASLTNALVRRGWRVDVWAAPYRLKPQRRKRYGHQGGQITVCGPFQLAAAAARNLDAVMHITSFSIYHLLPLLVRKVVRTLRPTGPIVYTANGLIAMEKVFGYRTIPFVARLAERLIVRLSDVVVAVSEKLGKEVTALVPSAEVVVIPNGVSVDEPGEADPRVVADLAGKRFILYAGGTHPNKGLELLLEALRMLPSDCEWMLVIAGACDPRKLAELPYDSRVRIVGSIDSATLFELYRLASVVVVPSRSETFGLVALEAVLAGTWTIVTDTVETSKIVAESGGGEVVPYGDAMALSAAIARALIERRESSGAQQIVRDQFDWDTVAERYERVYDLYRRSRDRRSWPSALSA